MDLLDISLFMLAAFAGGAVNSVAGGGTFITFPLLIVSGLTALQANILSTIALWPGAVASAFAYRKEQKITLHQIKGLVVASLIGSAIGTAILLLAPESVFEALVPWLLLFATLLLAFGGKFKAKQLPTARSVDRAGGKIIFLQFLIAIYGGYFGAGIGILMLAALQLAGFSHMHQMNALKAILGSAINAVAVVIFIASGKVVWPIAVFMIAGGIVGGYVGARLALKVQSQTVRRLVVLIGFLMSVYFFVGDI
ncbi:MAG: sulfite exporter TauE/SafE family protein [Alphaproteobacteria bacterium]